MAGTRQGFNGSKGFDDGAGSVMSKHQGAPNNSSPFNQTTGSMGVTTQNTANLKGKFGALDVSPIL